MADAVKLAIDVRMPAPMCLGQAFSTHLALLQEALVAAQNYEGDGGAHPARLPMAFAACV